MQRFQAIVLAFGAALALNASVRADDFGDDCAHAGAVAPDQTAILGQVEAGSDQDWFDLPVQRNELVNLTIASRSVGFWPRVTIFAADCQTQLGSADRDYGETTALAVAPATGVLRVRVDTSAHFETGGYRVDIDRRGVVTDDCTSPTPISEGQVVYGRIDYDGETDQFLLAVPSRSILRVELAGTTCCGGALLRVMAGGLQLGRGAQATHLADPGEFMSSTFVVPDGTAGPVSVLMSDDYPGNSGMGYRLRVTRVGSAPAADDHGGECAEATPIMVGGDPITAFLTRGDDDRFAFNLERGHLYGFSIRGDSPLSDARVRLFSESCQTPLVFRLVPPDSPDSTFSDWSYYAEAEGRYVLSLFNDEVWGNDPRIGLYRLWVTDLGAFIDDFPNTREHATELSPGAAVITGMIDYARDADWFRVTIPPFRMFDIQTRGLAPSQAPRIVVYGPFGGSLPVNRCGECPGGWTSTRLLSRPGQSTELDIEVTDYWSNGYQIRVTDLGAGPVTTPSASCDAARPGPVGGPPIPVVATPVAPEDYIAFPIAAHRRYRIDLTDATAAPPRLEAYLSGPLPGEECGRPLTRPGSDIAPLELETGAQPGSRLTVRFGLWGDVFSAAGTLRLLDLGPATDGLPAELDGAPALAVNGAPLNEAIDFAGDVDVIRVALKAGRLYRFETQIDRVRLYEPLDVLVQPVSGFGPTVAWSHYGYPVGFRSSWEGQPLVPEDDGEYFIMLAQGGYESPGPGGYRIRVFKPGCRADLDDSGVAGLEDLFAYLAAYLAGDGRGEFDGIGQVTMADLFDFLNAWFGGCG